MLCTLMHDIKLKINIFIFFLFLCLRAMHEDGDIVLPIRPGRLCLQEYTHLQTLFTIGSGIMDWT